MQDKTIQVTPSEKSVTIGGETYIIPDLDWPAHVHMLMWEPMRDRLRGYISQVGDAYRFDNFDQFKPYVAAWEDAKAKADAEKEAQRQADEAAAAVKKEAEEKEAAERQAAHDAVLAEIERQRPVVEAQSALASTDFKIIKAMEAKLLADGALDPDLVAKREAARQTIRDSKA
mgnify:FL=1